MLIIEDDLRLAGFIARFLTAHQLRVEHAADPIEGEALLGRSVFDCVVLDVMLPGRDGFEVCRRIRSMSGIPIIMISARAEEPDRVVGIELGADDYLTKPFSTPELLARIRAVARRAAPAPSPTIAIGGLVIDLARRSVSRQGRPLDLSPAELEVLLALARRPGTVVERNRLAELAHRELAREPDHYRGLDVHVSRLRAKLGDDAHLLKTVRGVGYLLAEPS